MLGDEDICYKHEVEEAARQPVHRFGVTRDPCCTAGFHTTTDSRTLAANSIPALCPRTETWRLFSQGAVPRSASISDSGDG